MHLETAEVALAGRALVPGRDPPGGLCLLHFYADWDEVGKALESPLRSGEPAPTRRTPAGR